MIEDYENDAKMAEAGRRSVKWKAINTAKEEIRDLAVLLGNTSIVEAVKNYKKMLNESIDDLIEALELK